MIDVVFLLLVFFMLAARFGISGAVPLTAAGGGLEDGPPRLIDISPDGLRLNGAQLADQEIVDALAALPVDLDELVVLRSDPDTDLQRLVDVMELLSSAGYSALSVVERQP